MDTRRTRDDETKKRKEAVIKTGMVTNGKLTKQGRDM